MLRLSFFICLLLSAKLARKLDKRQTYEFNYISDSIIVEDSYADILQNNNGKGASSSEISVVTMNMETSMTTPGVMSNLTSVTTPSSTATGATTTRDVSDILVVSDDVQVTISPLPQNITEIHTGIATTSNSAIFTSFKNTFTLVSHLTSLFLYFCK